MPHLGAVDATAFHPDGRTWATGDATGAVRLYRAGRTNAPLRALKHGSGVRGAALSPDGKTAATGTGSGSVFRWDLRTGRQLASPIALPTSARADHWVSAVAFSPDGNTLYAGAQQDAVVWRVDVASGRIEPWIRTGQKELLRIALSRDGRRLLTGAWYDPTDRLWDASSGKAIGDGLLHDAPAPAVAFRPDGDAAVTGSQDGTIRVWDAATGGLLTRTKRRGSGIEDIAYSPDGKTVLTGGMDQYAQMWDAATLEPVGQPMLHDDPLECVAFSPDGRVVLTGCQDGTARFWHVATGQRIGPVLHHANRINAVAWGPDGGVALTGADDGDAKLWETPTPVPEDLDQVVRWVELLTGMELDETGTIRVLAPEAWQDRRLQFRGPLSDALEDPGDGPDVAPRRRPEDKLTIEDCNSRVLQKWVERARATGLRPTMVGAWSDGGSPRFLGVAVIDPHPPDWEVRNELTAEEGEKAFDQLSKAGYRPLCVSGYLSGKAPRFTATWVKDGKAVRWATRFNLPIKEYEEAVASLKREGLRPGVVSEYPDGVGSYRFTAVFVPADDAPWEARYELTAAQFQQNVTEWDQKGYRTATVCVHDTAGGPLFSAVFVKDGRWWEAHHGMTADAYQGKCSLLNSQGCQVVSAAAYHDGIALRYAAVWGKGE